MGSRLTPSMGRFFEASKSDPGQVSSWEGQLQQWGAKSLEKLNAEDRQTEVAKRQSGAIAVSAGGELTLGPIIPADSALSASSHHIHIKLQALLDCQTVRSRSVFCFNRK